MKKIIVNNHRASFVDTERPVLEKQNRLLIKVRYSAVSPGTELKLIHQGGSDGRTLGYSASGEVVEAGDEAADFKQGDLVACYGAPYVYHTEYLSVPSSLCVKLSSDRFLRSGALIGLGAIAVHSVRRLELQFGETVWVIGLGLLGQLVAQICQLAHYRVVATDPQPNRIELAKTLGIEAAYLSSAADLQQVLNSFSPGGLDAVSLCLTSSNPTMVDDALEQLALRGKIVLVGNVPMHFDRQLFFRKEAQLLVSRAGGPGRYDPRYEDEGIDYPKPFVRWTEGRNMEEFIRLLEKGALQAEPYLTHEFPFREAERAYRELEEGQAAMLGVLFRYD
ncbi:zinc-binding alcohol dehydrogenase [Paenibacillus sp. IB182496]|uniref:Zinc-binding alcohol dehydrogenase n=1 Tax=Paenibacillus sabuli TaxID=2772509 RepID=A0A927BNY1_9BACL|nr:zinc-binding alcohol dehydrogenase [Paenibacillus sabuli]MBD2844031.1 zinc-binding alcohol dehydrogenase [Paenibacillus sabuli]